MIESEYELKGGKLSEIVGSLSQVTRKRAFLADSYTFDRFSILQILERSLVDSLSSFAELGTLQFRVFE
jgi:hypothetical protein